MSDRTQMRLELIKLVWSPGIPGDVCVEAIARAKALEAYVLPEGEELPAPAEVSKAVPASRRR